MEKKNRLISFDRDIIDEVVRKSGGKFTEGQVQWCLNASVSYIHHLLRYTDITSVRVPFLGEMVVNLREMKVRRNKLVRAREYGKWGSRSEAKALELSCLEDKIKDVEEAANGLKRGDPLISDNHERQYQRRRGFTFEEIQDLQDEMFNR